MSQLFTNLVSNALKFCRAGMPPVIIVTATVLSAEEIAEHNQPTTTGDYYNLQFCDNGIALTRYMPNRSSTSFSGCIVKPSMLVRA